jgi:hypothetical protein
MALATHFVTLDIPLASDLASDAVDWVTLIESALAERGEPLRWAITQVDRDRQTATVEAVVTVQS